MATVGTLTDQFSTLQLEGSEGKTAPPEAVEASVFKTHTYICVAKRLNGAVRLEYATGEITIFENFANLNFNTSETPPEEMSDFLGEIPKLSVNDFSSDIQVREYFILPAKSKTSQVTTILVNVLYSYPPLRSSAIVGIGTLCKAAFQNMKAEQSSVNVRHNFRHWTVDSVLLPTKSAEIWFREK